MKAFSHQRSGRAEALIPSSMKQRSPRILKENLDPNPSAVESSPFRPSTFPPKPPASKNRSPLPPRPPTSSNLPLKRKQTSETLPDNGSQALDSVVQVIVRMRPLNKDDEEKEQIVHKISPNSISVLDHTFTFDSVADVTSTQQDIYQLVGLPLVENCLAGFNSSIFAYGQTGSGKTYTMWGPPSALSEEDLSSSERGLTPRVFDRLFYRINEEQAKSSDKELSYHCRCSFLEIYNEQITDLLDPAQRTLQIREDVRTGVYVDFLTEECVCTMKDVNQLLIKGLENRRTGATSINAESSRSHCVFTCVVESRSKMADGLSSLRISRINLVDLAGSERQKLTGAAGDRLKEAGNINRSLSQLGNLINILAEVSQSGKQRHIPYRDSKLTFLLQESLGGNAKLAMICAVSLSQSCKNETFSTLRFAQRAKAIKNKAIVNEVMQDDVNVLREQIRQLKDELVRMKSNGSTVENNGSYSTGWNARRSLNLLRMSLNRPTILPAIKDDSDEEMEIDEDDVERPYIQSARQSSSCEEKVSVQSENSKELRSSASNNDVVLGDIQTMQRFRSVCGTDQVCEMIDYIAEDSQPEKIAGDEVLLKSDMEEYGCIDDVSGKSHDNSAALLVMDQMVLVLQDKMLSTERKPLVEKTFVSQDPHAARDSSNISLVVRSHDCTSSPNSIVVSSNLSIVPCEKSPVLQLPSLSTSPVSQGYSRKSIRISSSMSASPRSTENKKLDIGGVLNLSFSGSLVNKPANASIGRTSKNVLAPTEHLAASLHYGLQVIENHQNNSAVRRSAFRFSMRPVELKPLMPVSKIDVAVQTLAQELEMSVDLSTFVCNNCKNKASPDKCGDTNNDKDLQLVHIDGPQTSDQLKQQVPKVVEKVLAGAIRREMALEDHCAKQAAEIVQLNCLVQQYKHERECNAIIGQTREDKISRLEGLMDGILPREEFMEEEFISLANEHKLLKEKYEYHPEVLGVNVELKRVQDELDGYRNFSDMGERDVLMEEIQDLRTQLQAYVDSSTISNRKLGQLLRLTHPSLPTSAPLKSSELIEESADEKLEQERRLWTERESNWISLSEDLRLELEATRSLSENRKMELGSEKKCSEELKEALQIAMQGYARILEQYADLEEKHMVLLNRNRKISEGIEDVKRAAAKAGVKRAESKFIDSLAAEISALRAEREKEGRYWRDENKGLRTQLRDTAEAVQAAGELLVRLKEAEEATTIAQRRTVVAEQETEKAYQEFDKLKKSYEQQIAILNQYLADSRLPKEALRPALDDGPDVATYDEGESLTDQRWREEYEPFQRGDGEFSRGTEPYAWYSGYDRCNI